MFIPRWQTETLAARAADLLVGTMGRRALDLFCGSGAIAAVLAQVPGSTVHAGELDPAALRCARRNGDRHGFAVHASDVAAGIPESLQGSFDVVTANVPYVPSGELHRSAGQWGSEPVPTRDGGDDGLAWTRRVLDVLPEWLRPGGWFLTEIGGDQEPVARALFAAAGLVEVERLDDPDGDLCGLMGRLPTGAGPAASAGTSTPARS